MKRSPGRPAERENVPKRPEKAEDDEEVEEGGGSLLIHRAFSSRRCSSWTSGTAPRKGSEKEEGLEMQVEGIKKLASIPYLSPLLFLSLLAAIP